jgi:hypothetical protein
LPQNIAAPRVFQSSCVPFSSLPPFSQSELRSASRACDRGKRDANNAAKREVKEIHKRAPAGPPTVKSKHRRKADEMDKARSGQQRHARTAPAHASDVIEHATAPKYKSGYNYEYKKGLAHLTKGVDVAALTKRGYGVCSELLGDFR